MTETESLDPGSPRETDRSRYLAPALSRGLDVLETLASHADGLSPAALSQRLDLTTSQLFRILATLEHRGFIARSGSGDRYILTFRMYSIAWQQPLLDRLMAEAGPALRDLVRRCGQSVVLSNRDGTSMVVLAFIPAQAPVSLTVPVGQIFPLFTSTAGMFHFAQEPPGIRDRLLRELGPELTRPEVQERLSLAQSLTGARSHVEPSRDMAGITNHTCVLREINGRPLASLTLAYVVRPDAPVSEADAHAAMLQTADSLERRLSGAASPAK